MVKNMQPFNTLEYTFCNQLEPILSSLHISYKRLPINDGDLNYSICINTAGKLKSLNTISCTLYLHKADFSCNLIVGNIYNISHNEDLIKLYEIINKISFRTRIGNFLIHDIDGKKQLIYKSSINCGREFCELTSELIQLQIKEFTDCLEYLLFQLIDNRRKVPV